MTVKKYVIAIIMLLAVTSLVRVYRVSDISMDYTVTDGDIVITENLSAGIHVPSFYGYVDAHIWRHEQGIHRGDLLAFRHPLDQRLYLKRCVAIPGDALYQHEKHFYLQLDANSTRTYVYAQQHHIPWVQTQDGYWLKDPYAAYDAITHRPDVVGPGVLITYPKIRLKPHQYFLMGDFRDNSTDSRFFGPVDYDHIYYKVWWIIKRSKSFSALGNLHEI